MKTLAIVLVLLACASAVLADESAEVQQALQILAVDDTDEEANDIAGRHYCFVRGDWSRGLPLLAKSGKAKFQPVAEQELRGATTTAEQIRIADMWWELAQEKQPDFAAPLMIRARHWYGIAAPHVTGLSKRKCEKRLAATEGLMAVARNKPTDRSKPGLEFDGEAWLETEVKYDGKTPITIGIWVTPAADGIQSIVANCHGVGLALQVSEDGHWAFQVRDKKRYQGAVSNEKVRLGQRVHVAGVFDGQIIRLFVNGHLQDKIGTMTSGHKVSGFRFMIGADPDFHSRPQQQFRGILDSVHVCREVLYTKDFTPRDPPGRTPSSLLLLKLDEGEGDIATDSSGHRHDAKIHGAKWK